MFRDDLVTELDFMEESATMPGVMIDNGSSADIVAALNVWRNSLVNLTGVNRLIKFKHSKTGTVQIGRFREFMRSTVASRPTSTSRCLPSQSACCIVPRTTRTSGQHCATCSARPSRNTSTGDLHDRFAIVHKGLRKLFGDYRRDKKTVAAFAQADVPVEEAIGHLSLAIAWQQARADFDAAVAVHAAILGSYWQQHTTDFSILDEALGHAEQILRLAPADAVAGITEHVCDPAPAPELRGLIRDTRTDLEQWRATLAPAPLPAARPVLLLEPLPAVITWLRQHVPIVA
jgi:hypothetical protein